MAALGEKETDESGGSNKRVHANRIIVFSTAKSNRGFIMFVAIFSFFKYWDGSDEYADMFHVTILSFNFHVYSICVV